jgi:hypothetical protein
MTLRPFIEANLNSAEMCECVLDRGIADEPLIEKIYDTYAPLPYERKEHVLRSIAFYVRTPYSIIEKMIENGDANQHLLQIITRRVDCTNATLDKIFSMDTSNMEAARFIVDRDEPLPDNTVKMLLGSKSPEVALYAMKRLKLSQGMIDWFVDNASERSLAHAAEYLIPMKYHYLMLCIAEKVKLRSVLYAMTNYNNGLTIPIIVTLMDNPTVRADPALIYCTYCQVTPYTYSSLAYLFTKYREQMDEFAAKDSRMSLAEIDERRAKEAERLNVKLS